MHVGFAFQSNLTGLQTVYQNGRKSDQEFANGDMNFQKFSERQMDRIPGTSAEAWCKNGSQCQLQPITRRREVSADKVSSMMGGACIDMSMEEIGTVYGRAVLSTLPAVSTPWERMSPHWARLEWYMCGRSALQMDQIHHRSEASTQGHLYRLYAVCV